jgi:arsenate reductase (glutaredoxin)
MKVFVYEKCDTCRKALKFLAAKGVPFEKVAIRETPPTVAQLQRMLEFTGDLKRLFNTSGGDYRALNLKERLPAMSLAEVLSLLATNGNLVKRPFLLTETWGTTGFSEDEWSQHLAK